jgi:hypothetical protein
MLDVPTQWIGYNTGNPASATRGNYCTWNPLVVGATITDGNLTATNSSYSDASGSMSMFQSGRYYAEFTYNSVTSSDALVGITLARFNGTGQSDTVRVAYQTVGQISREGVATPESLGGYPTYTAGDIIGIALDVGSGAITFYKNNTLVYTFTTSVITANEWRFFCRMSNRSFTANFGQRPFAYTPPAGFLSLCTTNLPNPTILQGGQFFNPILYTGTGSTRTQTGVGFQPDFTWVKRRDGVADHGLMDAVRGATRRLQSNLTAAEDGFGFTAFAPDGFTFDGGIHNDSGWTFVAWNWNAGGTTVTNTSGSISAQVRANPTAGFSVVTYTGTGANATAGHGLGVAPRMVIVKCRNQTRSWPVYHASIGNTGFVQLQATTAALFTPSLWNNTTPTSTVFSLGSDPETNGSGNTYVAYCFAAVPGYSAFGSYTGNASTDGPFVFTGFRPEFVMVKNSSGTGDWIIWDSARNTFNVTNSKLSPNTSGAEFTDTSAVGVDFLSNGFKLRGTDNAVNTTSATYIYYAVAENPFKNALAR